MTFHPVDDTYECTAYFLVSGPFNDDLAVSLQKVFGEKGVSNAVWLRVAEDTVYTARLNDPLPPSYEIRYGKRQVLACPVDMRPDPDDTNEDPTKRPPFNAYMDDTFGDEG